MIYVFYYFKQENMKSSCEKEGQDAGVSKTFSLKMCSHQAKAKAKAI